MDRFHSVVFERDGESYHTWEDWHLVPSSRPLVAPPGIKSTWVGIPAADGSINLSSVVHGRVTYNDRNGNWQFIVQNGFREWQDHFSNIQECLKGHNDWRIILCDDPEYYYYGTAVVTGWSSGTSYSTITIEYRVEPYKYPIDSTTREVGSF